MKIKFMPMNVECDVDPSKSLLEIAKANGLKIKSICNGVPSCAECRVRITEGENSIPEPSKAELNLIGSSYFLDGRRLSCQVHCFGSVTVDLTEQLNKVDTQKKVRGFKQKDQKEISAVQDTMILNATEVAHQNAQQAQQQQKPQQQKPSAPKPQQQAQHKNSNPNQNNNQNRNHNQKQQAHPNQQNKPKGSGSQAVNANVQQNTNTGPNPNPAKK